MAEQQTRNHGEIIASLPGVEGNIYVQTDLGGEYPDLEFSVYFTAGKERRIFKIRYHYPVATADLRRFAEEILRRTA
jgi:hypothetical protein